MSNRPFIRLAAVFTVVILLAAAFIASFDHAVLAQGSELSVMTSNNTNLRSTPDNAGTVLATIPTATQLTAIGRNAATTWILVTYQEQQGWIDVQLLSTTGRYRLLPVVAVTSNLDTTGGQVYAQILAPTIIRGGPGTQYERLGSFQIGDTVLLDGQSFGWYRFSFPNSVTKGWISWKYIQVVGDFTALPNVTYDPNDLILRQ